MWVKLHDSWLDWEWADNPNMVALFFRLVTMAAKFDKRIHGHELKRGQCLIGRKKLSERTGISEQTLRTCLAKLEETGEITRKSTNKFTIVTICNFDYYQQTNEITNQQLTSNQPTTNQQLTTPIEYKNKELSIVEIRARLEEATINNPLWLDQTAMSLHSTNILQTAMDVMKEWELTEVPVEEWTAMHLFNHIRKKLEIAKSQQKMSKQEAKEARRAELKRQMMNDLKAV